MIPIPSGVRVWLATGHTDMRKGFPGLSLQVQEVLRRDPLSGHLFCFRGRRGDLLKVIWHDGQGACLFTKKLERGRFLLWPLSTSSGMSQRALGASVELQMITIRTGEDAEFYRRSLRLLCGDWVPHYDGASEGCLALAADVSGFACPTEIRGSPLPRSAPSLVRIERVCAVQLANGTR